MAVNDGATTSTRANKINDLVGREYSADFCRETLTLTDPGVTGVQVKGQPVSIDRAAGTATLLAIANIANTEGMVITTGTTVDTETMEVVVLTRPPAEIKKAGLPTSDVDSATLTTASYVAALEALGFKLIDAPANVYTTPTSSTQA